MPDRKPGTSPEQQQIASEIYGKLQNLRGTASLDGFNRGEVIFPKAMKRVKVIRIDTISEIERPLFRERGFTEEDINNGITVIIQSDFLNPNWPNQRFVSEPTTAYLNISGTGKVFGGNPHVEEMRPTQLNQEQREALQKIGQLSIIPRQIAEIFGSYEDFVSAVGEFDRIGIDWTERKPVQIMYNGGLNLFVRALELKQTGELGKLDTALHALKDSLDSRDHFTKLYETLQNLRESDTNQPQ